jgi:ABC-type sugar transport system ATPase subunit
VSPGRLVRTLKVAAQQQVEIAKALALNARLLILDEPTAALGAEETDHLFEQVDALRAEGVSFIYVSHRLEEIARICDRVVVLRDGEWVASHDTAQLPVRKLVEDMVGRSIEKRRTGLLRPQLRTSPPPPHGHPSLDPPCVPGPPAARHGWATGASRRPSAAANH